MLTRLRIKNFKQFEDVDIELGQSVVLIGPNNSGKTSALQALALWYSGLQKWWSLLPDWHIEPAEHPYLTINRYDLYVLPVPSIELLWRNLRSKQNTENVFIEIWVDGLGKEKIWSQQFKFEFVNEESLYCFPSVPSDFAFIHHINDKPQLVYLPPMSGLIATEDRWERGSINRRIGEGRTAEVLRNLCYQVYESNSQTGNWDKITTYIRDSFGVELLPPDYLPARGEIRMAYQERGITLDLSSSGRGMQQILLLLSYMYANPGAVLLLDEPDAHLEILRQREVYHLLMTVAGEQGSQIIAASHSEIVLDEAADRDTVIAFVGQPHRMDKRNKSQVAKALKKIRAVDYALVQQTGWILYLEGATDLAILRSFATLLDHQALQMFGHPFVHYLETNKPRIANDHFSGLLEAKSDLVGVALFDKIPSAKLQHRLGLVELMWKRREIENYLLMPETFIAYAADGAGDGEVRMSIMRELIASEVAPAALNDRTHPFWHDTKASDFMDRLFEVYYQKLGLPNLMRKTNYHVLANFVPPELIDAEVIEKLDAIVEVAKQAKPIV